MTPESPRRYTRRIEAAPEAARAALARAAEGWGADFTPDAEGGRLALPVNAGLRHGRLEGRVHFRPDGGATEIAFEVEREEYELPRTQVGLLLSGALGTVSVLLWPFFPRLAVIAPFGAVIAVAVWFLVLAKVRYVGAELFLENVENVADDEDEDRE